VKTTAVAFLLAEFSTPDGALGAASTLVRDGVRDVDVHSPYPLHGSDEALGLGRPRLVPAIALCAGAGGGTAAYLMQWWMNAVDYPLIVGARPAHAPPAFAPITFEVAVLSAGIAIVATLLVVWRMPRLHHPLFDADAFRSASQDAFWVSAPYADGVEGRLRALGARRVTTVEGA
jgi:hypothetical protein